MKKSDEDAPKKKYVRKKPNSTDDVIVRKAKQKKTSAPQYMASKKNTGAYTPYTDAWKVRASVWLKQNVRGPKFRYADPNEFWIACCEYFEWVQNTPINVPVVIKEGRESPKLRLQPKLRPMSLTGLCIFLGIDLETWRAYRKNREEMAGVISSVEQIIYMNKFDGACIDIFNSKIISRDLANADAEKDEAGTGSGFLGVYNILQRAGISKKEE